MWANIVLQRCVQRATPSIASAHDIEEMTRRIYEARLTGLKTLYAPQSFESMKNVLALQRMRRLCMSRVQFQTLKYCLSCAAQLSAIKECGLWAAVRSRVCLLPNLF